ncbi:uncharacterized protein LOC129571042 [Sitodiplosis mosellana]|uniref:uncharacterized protein LOC129571042 n=1 Tax=Sitodiplosis mosellana TaxID=263140 RepID=UPI00244408A3|nr:uncharacterized protein LOC129571042 [Sitodiplosis mosellana]
MPAEDKNIIQFKNWQNQLECPFIIYADVEALLKVPDVPVFKGKKREIAAYQEHEVYSVGYYFKCSFDESKSFYASKRGPDCIDWFVDQMKTAAEFAAQHLNNIIPLNMTAEQEQRFQNTHICHICEKQFDSDSIKVRDHSHLTGEFRGAAHQDCNLNYVENRAIPVVFHNLTGYDSHFLLRKLANGFAGDMQIIPINTERYISFSKTVEGTAQPFKEDIKLRFIDSFRFMADSLDTLSSLIPSEKKRILRTECKHLSEEQLKLLERKGIFCYDYIDSWEKLNDTSLPSKEAFHSTLTNSSITDKDYDFAKEVWDKFNIKDLGEYSDLYLKTDVLLLADVFENFRKTCQNIYKLDPANYYTAPGLSFDAMLRYTNVQLELFTDVDMLMFVERGIRGGISQCSTRYIQANNKFMDNYNPNKETSYIMYLDANNLYGHSMMQHLPHNNFQWSDVKFDRETILNLKDDADIGYVFEVDLDYPKELHDLHNDYPFCAQNMHVPGKKGVKKLLLTLYDKKNYVIHYRMLKLALQHGLVLRKVHRVLQFNQTAWLKPYIQLNTEMRTRATNDFEKNFFKLLCNAIFGKTMENLRSRVDIKLKSQWGGRSGARMLIAKPNFKRRTIFDEDLVAIELKKTSLLMNKPIVVGLAILDISKVVMYDFHYNFMKSKYGDKVQLAYTDTDSFIYKISCENFYDDMKQHLEKFDTSDYKEDNPYNMPRVNKKVPGLFKDELNGEIITKKIEFISH